MLFRSLVPFSLLSSPLLSSPLLSSRFLSFPLLFFSFPSSPLVFSRFPSSSFVSCPVLSYHVLSYFLPSQLLGCPRSLLDTDNVLYLHTDVERLPYVVLIDQSGLLRYPCTNTLVSTGKEGWIFVTKNGILYACAKQTKAIPR